MWKAIVNDYKSTQKFWFEYEEWRFILKNNICEFCTLSNIMFGLFSCLCEVMTTNDQLMKLIILTNYVLSAYKSEKILVLIFKLLRSESAARWNCSENCHMEFLYQNFNTIFLFVFIFDRNLMYNNIKINSNYKGTLPPTITHV